MTLIKSLSFKIGIILLSIWLFVSGAYLEAYEGESISFCKHPSACCYFDQEDMLHTLKNIVRVWFKTICQEQFIIEMAGKLGFRKRFSRFEGPKTILLIFIVCWGIALIFVLGAIFYRIFIGPLIEKRKLTWNERGKNNNSKSVKVKIDHDIRGI